MEAEPIEIYPDLTGSPDQSPLSREQGLSIAVQQKINMFQGNRDPNVANLVGQLSSMQSELIRGCGSDRFAQIDQQVSEIFSQLGEPSASY